MDSDEEERLRQWKEHLANQNDSEDDDALPPMHGEEGGPGGGAAAADLSAEGRRARPGSDRASASPPSAATGRLSARGSARKVAGRSEEHGADSENVDWAMTLMPQMREMQAENTMLLRKIQQQEREMAAMRSAGIGDRPTSGDRPMDAKESKIVELAKKNRSLTVNLEKERARSGRMAAEIARLNGDLETAKKGRDLAGMDARSLPQGAGGLNTANSKKKLDGAAAEEPVSVEQKLKDQQAKMSTMNSALNAQRVANDSLKQECAKLREALKKELGDVPVERALDDGGSWTGRAQQVSLLQSKVSQLKRELATARESARGASRDGTAAPSSPQHMDAAMKAEEQRRREIEKIERDRRREAETSADELAQLRADRDALKTKHDAALSRVKNVERDCRDLREKVSTLLTKTDNDDGLIAALQNEMQAMAKRAKEERRRDKEQGAANEAQELRAEIRDKDAQIERQHKIIVSLRAEAQAASMRREGEQREAREAGAESVRTNAQAHKARVCEVQLNKAGEFIEVLKRKLEEAEERMRDAVANLRKEKQRCVELERKAEGRQQSAGRRANSAGYPPEKVEMLVDRLNSVTEEMDALQDSFRRTLEAKEEELQYFKDLSRQLQQQMDEGQASLERQLQQLMMQGA